MRKACWRPENSTFAMRDEFSARQQDLQRKAGVPGTPLHLHRQARTCMGFERLHEQGTTARKRILLRIAIATTTL